MVAACGYKFSGQSNESLERSDVLTLAAREARGRRAIALISIVKDRIEMVSRCDVSNLRNLREKKRRICRSFQENKYSLR